jgi:hypothetical protein
MGRPLNKKYFGIPVPGGIKIACQAWVAGDDQARSGTIVEQTGNSRYVVRTAGGESICYLVPEITGPEQMVIQVVTPNGTLPARKVRDGEAYTWEGGFWPNWRAINGQLVYGEATTGSHWAAAYGPEGWFSTGSGCSFDSDGNLVVIGAKYDGESENATLFKLSPTGEKIWEYSFRHSYPVYGYDTGQLVQCDDAGNIYAVISSYDDVTGDKIFVAKLDSNATILWQKQIDLSYDPYDIAVDPSNGDVAVSFFDSNFSIFKNTVMVFDSSGNVRWQKSFNSPGFNYYAIGIAYTTGNRLCAVASYFNDGTQKKGVVAWTINSAGDLVWDVSVEEPVDHYFKDYGVAVDSDPAGNIYVHFGFYRDTDGSDGAVHMKINGDGVIQWRKEIIDPTYGFTPYSIIVDGFGNAYSNGDSDADGSEGQIFLKFSTDGDLEWSNMLTNSGSLSNGWQYSCQDMSVSGDSFAFAGNQNLPDDGPEGYYHLITKLPVDGSKLGTKGIFTYQAVDLTAVNNTWTLDDITVVPTSEVRLVSAGTLARSAEDVYLSVTYF